MPPPITDPPSSSSCPHHLHLHATPQPTSPPPPRHHLRTTTTSATSILQPPQGQQGAFGWAVNSNKGCLVWLLHDKGVFSLTVKHYKGHNEDYFDSDSESTTEDKGDD
ncbi:hypothetical protein Tco_1024014 [Tanacetum coccineum]